MYVPLQLKIAQTLTKGKAMDMKKAHSHLTTWSFDTLRYKMGHENQVH